MLVKYGKSIGHYLFVTVGKSEAKTMTEEKCSGHAEKERERDRVCELYSVLLKDREKKINQTYIRTYMHRNESESGIERKGKRTNRSRS